MSQRGHDHHKKLALDDLDMALAVIAEDPITREHDDQEMQHARRLGWSFLLQRAQVHATLAVAEQLDTMHTEPRML